MTTKGPTIQGVRAKLKREAAAAGLYLELKHSLKGYQTGVKVNPGYVQEARRADLLHVSDCVPTRTAMDWVRSVLTANELLTVSVMVEVNNSEIQIDYFSTDWVRILPNWDAFVDLGTIAHRWANDLLGLENSSGWSYDRGIHNFTCAEIASLCPSEAHAIALAVCVSSKHRLRLTPGLVNRLAGFDATGLALFQAMLPDWDATMDDLLDAVEVLVPQVSPAPTPVELAPVLVEPAEVKPVRVEPAALVEYLGRLLHAPKKDYAVTVWAAVRDGAAVPEHSADWAADVVRKVRRYATA